MADYPALSFVDLSSFSGRPTSDYNPVYSSTAISQATLLFKIATCLTALPDIGTVPYDLAKNAMMAMADQFVLSQPYAEDLASPFSSETIGSYSYSKMAQQIISKERTGVMWFDLAVGEMGVCDENDQAFFFGGIEIMEHDGKFGLGSHGEGNIRLLTISDTKLHSFYMHHEAITGPYKNKGE